MGHTNTHTTTRRRTQRSVSPQAARLVMTAVPCMSSWHLACTVIETGGSIRPPIAVLTCARVMAGDRLHGIESPWRGLYMYSQPFTCRIHLTKAVCRLQ